MIQDIPEGPINFVPLETKKTIATFFDTNTFKNCVFVDKKFYKLLSDEKLLKDLFPKIIYPVNQSAFKFFWSRNFVFVNSVEEIEKCFLSFMEKIRPNSGGEFQLTYPHQPLNDKFEVICHIYSKCENHQKNYDDMVQKKGLNLKHSILRVNCIYENNTFKPYFSARMGQGESKFYNAIYKFSWANIGGKNFATQYFYLSLDEKLKALDKENK